MTRAKKLSREEKLEKKRIAERLRYEKIKNDPVKLAAQKEKNRQKYLTRREKGQRKLISEMTDREKRQTRKKWKSYSKTYYGKKTAMEKATKDFVRENTPSSLCDENVNPNIQQQVGNVPNLTPRVIVARKRALKQRKERNRKLQIKDKEIRNLKAKLQKYKKRYTRLKEDRKKQHIQDFSPRTKMMKLAEDVDTRVQVVKKALFGETLEKQLTENISSLKTSSEKRLANKILLGPLVKENKIWKTENRIITYKKIWHSQRQNKQNRKKRKSLKSIVQKFLEDDKYTRLCAGKKEFITKNKVRKQKRYLLDKLQNLHKEFLRTGNAISYSMFARLRPFWILAPKVTDRDTCLCTTHTNIQLVILALNTSKILKIADYQNLLTSLCCDRYNERCLERTCDICRDRVIPFQEDFNDTKKVTYKQWLSSKEIIIDPKTKKERTVIKQKKEVIITTARELKLKLEIDLAKFFKHELNIVHQYQSVKRLKESLCEKDVIVHMDFSENYCTKHNEEIQSFHFGGSRTQLSLHTVVVYLRGSTKSYCTVSSNLSHNVHAIWAHLRPILEEIPADVENMHFLSDGPVTQYRNKLMFYVLACKIPDLCPNIMNWTWNYTEAGHGKGAPDGIGAVCKRTADNIVACGGDITNLNEFCEAIQSRCPNITLFVVNDSDIDAVSRLISEGQPSLVPFSGTLKVHQVQGNVLSPNKLIMKSLSCFCNSDGCEHYRLGFLKYTTESRQSVDDVYGVSDSDRSETGSPNTMEDDHLVHSRIPEIYDRSKRTNEDDSESDDCFCLLCGALYSEDTSGNDWVQCIVCHQWAQTGCIKSDFTSFTCPHCLSDCDYK